MNTETLITDIPLDTAIRAHDGTSFNPERRGETARNDYAQTLAGDWESLRGEIGDNPEKLAILESEFARYREGYRKRYLAYLHSNARCVSWAIAGPSNFPAARMQKRADIAHKRLNEFIEFRKRALEAIRRAIHPEWRPIMAGDSNAVERLREKIAEAEQMQEQMKAVNAAHKAFLKNPASLDESGLPDRLKETVRRYVPEYSWEPHPIAPYELTNNGANIRRMKERLEQITRARSTPETKSAGSNADFEDCPAENRVRLRFPGKPAVEIRDQLKRSGFRWAPTLGVWQAYRNWNTLKIAREIAGIPATPE